MSVSQPQSNPRALIKIFRPSEQREPAMTLGAYWRDLYRAEATRQLEGGTIAEYEGSVSKWVAITGDPPLTDLNRVHFLDFLEQLARYPGRKGSAISPFTVRKHERHIKTVLARAKEDGWIDSVETISPRRRGSRRQKLAPEPPRPWTVAEVERMIAGFQTAKATAPNNRHVSIGAWWKAFIGCAYWTGLRIETLCWMEWSWLDAASQVLRVPAEAMKESKPTIKYVHRQCLAWLEPLRAEGTDVVFPWKNRRGKYCPHKRRKDNAGENFSSIAIRLGIKHPVRDQYRAFHAIRKTHGTEVIRAAHSVGDYDAVEAGKAALDHADQSTTREHYGASDVLFDVDFERQKRIIEALPVLRTDH